MLNKFRQHRPRKKTRGLDKPTRCFGLPLLNALALIEMLE